MWSRQKQSPGRTREPDPGGHQDARGPLGGGDHSVGAIPNSRLLPQLGMLLANASPADRTAFYAGMPFSVKVLWRLVGKRHHAKQHTQLFPGAPVPPTI